MTEQAGKTNLIETGLSKNYESPVFLPLSKILPK